jgi:hypothetical protein
VKYRTVWTAITNVMTFSLGVFIVIWEVLNKDHDPFLLSLSLVLLGIPGALVTLFPNTRPRPSDPGTIDSGSLPPSLPSQPQP